MKTLLILALFVAIILTACVGGTSPTATLVPTSEPRTDSPTESTTDSPTESTTDSLTESTTDSPTESTTDSPTESTTASSQAPAPAPFLAIRDNFNDPGSGWLISSSDTGENEYLGGEYRILVKKINWLRSAFAPSSFFSDFDFQVTARYEDATGTNSYGLFFRNDVEGNFYIYNIDPVNGVYQFRRRESSNWVSVINWTPSPYINLGTTPNVLRVIARGSRFELYVNGELLNTAVDATITEGRIGLIASSRDDPHGAEVFFDDLTVREFTSSIHLQSLSVPRADPGESLTLTGSGFDLDATTFVVFTDQLGNETLVQSTFVTETTVEVTVPVFLNVEQFRIQTGTVSVSVIQQSSGRRTVSEAVDDFQIADLPETGLAPGLVTLEVLDQIQQLLASTAQAWQNIEDASLGSVDALALRTNLLALQEQVLASRIPIQQLVDGEIQQFELGEISSQRVFLDLEALRLLDSMYVAFYLSDRAGSSGTTGRLQSPLPQWGECDQVLECIKAELNPFNAESTQEIFDKFNKYGTIANAAVGMATIGTILFTAVPAATIGSAVLTAGAVIYFTTTVAPSMMGASALVSADPFLRDTGRPVTVEDYQSTLKHMDEGSRGYLKGLAEDIALGGLFSFLKSAGANSKLIDFIETYLGPSRAILGLLDLAEPGTAPRQAFENSGTIYDRHPGRGIPTRVPLLFSVGILPEATADEFYEYSICDPKPELEEFCAAPQPVNPSGGRPYYTFSHGLGMPVGLTLSSNGILTGTLSVNTPTGQRRFEVCVTDKDGVEVCRETVLTVNPPQNPLIFSVGVLPDATVGEFYTYRFCIPGEPGEDCAGPLLVNPTGGTPHYTFSHGEDLPIGFLLLRNGSLFTSNVETPAGPQRFNVCVTDRDGTEVCQQAVINVIAAPIVTPLVFSVGVLPDATIGRPYRYVFCIPEPEVLCGGSDAPLTIIPSGGTPYYNFSHGLGMPLGFTLISNGILLGLPDAETPTGPHQFEVCVSDRDGTEVCRQAVIYVIAAPEPFVFYTGVLPEATIGEAYHYSFCDPEPASGLFCGGPLAANAVTINPARGTPHFTFSHGIGLPFGLTLNLNGVLTGTPLERTPTGSQRFDICVADQGGQSLCLGATIKVNAAPPPTTPTETSNWSGGYNTSGISASNGCPFSYSGTLTMTITISGNSFSGSAFRGGNQILDNVSCAVTGSVSASGTVSGTISGDTWNITFSLTSSRGSLNFDGTATLSGNTLSGDFGKGSFTLTRQ